jgi:DNA-binding GntR family transcriptional regulator
VRSRGQETYERLRRAIVLGEIRPNERLVEMDLAEALSVSRTPIRESLQRLAADGLVESSKRGWVVRELSLDAIREIYELREALEGFAARLTAMRASEGQIRKLEQLIARRSNNPPQPSERQWLVTNNDALHQAVFRACGNERLLREIIRTSEYYFNMRVASLYTDEEIAASAKQHADLVEAIVQHDGDRAEQVMRLHIRGALDVIQRHAT